MCGGLGVLPQKILVFLSSLDLISCNFSMIFAYFQTKRGLSLGGPKSFSCGGGGGATQGLGGFGPSSIYVKRGPGISLVAIVLEASLLP